MTTFAIVALLAAHVNSQLQTWSSIYESPIVKSPQPGWVRFCKGADYFDVFGNQCPVGVFWNPEKQDTKWDCICTRGPWRRSSGWCTNEDTQRFTEGELTCFKPDPAEKGGIQAMYYVGDRFSAWDSNLPILLTDYRSGIPVQKRDFGIEWEIPATRSRKEPGILIFRPREDFSVFNKFSSKKIRLCLRAPQVFNEATEGLFIYNVSQLFNNDDRAQTLQLTVSQGCYSWRERDIHEWVDILPEDLHSKNIVVAPYNSQSATDECRKCLVHAIPMPPTTAINGSPLEARDNPTLYDLRNVGVLRTEIDFQSERLGQYWASRLLHNGSDPVDGEFQELELLTKAAIMALETCNSTIIPLEFFQYFLIMFRLLLSESFKKFPPKRAISEVHYKKISELLTSCWNRKLMLTFQFSDTCPPLYEAYSTQTDPENIIQIDASPDYDSDPGRHDYLLETIWRLNAFLQYKCFHEFERDSHLIALVQEQIESMFTEDLVLRWYNPASSYNMYTLIMENHLDLDSTMKNFQRCVAAVRGVSRYPGNLNRPIDRPEIAQKRGVHLSSRIRSKRSPPASSDEYDEEDDERKSPYNLFSGKAACVTSMRSFMIDTDKEAGPDCW